MSESFISTIATSFATVFQFNTLEIRGRFYFQVVSNIIFQYTYKGNHKKQLQTFSSIWSEKDFKGF